MRKWEYRMEGHPLRLAQEQLTRLGAEGWELAGVVQGMAQPSPLATQMEPGVLFFLKRPLTPSLTESLTDVGR